jgi:hypothetical protein
MRKNKTIKVYEESGCYDIPEKASEFMAFWQSKLDKIPDEFIDSARIEVEANSYYDSVTLDVEITYVRPETDGEMETRECQEKQRADRDKKRKIEAYNKLKRELAL